MPKLITVIYITRINSLRSTQKRSISWSLITITFSNFVRNWSLAKNSNINNPTAIFERLTIIIF